MTGQKQGIVIESLKLSYCTSSTSFYIFHLKECYHLKFLEHTSTCFYGGWQSCYGNDPSCKIHTDWHPCVQHWLLYSHLQHHNDNDARRIKTQWQRCMNKRRMIKTHEGRRKKKRCRKTSLTIFYFSLYCEGSKGLFKGYMWEGAGDRT